MSDLVFRSAYQLAQMIRAREVSAVEVLDAHLAQIAQHNSKINAICTLDEKHAHSLAQQADEALTKGEDWGVFHGVPVTIKDVFETTGLRTTAGYIPLKDYIPPQDATAVAKVRKTGAVIFGKTNMAELGGDYQSINSLFPPVNNPWNLDYSAGGSSGGSAAAVAAGLSPLDIGNDIAGSIRQPAHFCGVYGLKPTDRRVSTAGTIPEVPGRPYCMRHMMTVGCFARSLEDVKLCFSVIAGADSRRPDVPPVALDVPSDQPLQSRRIAWIDQWPEVPVDAEIRTQMQKVVQTLEDAHVQVESWMYQQFDIAQILNRFAKLAVYVNIYAQPIDRYNLGHLIQQMWRSATQGDKTLRALDNFSRVIPELLNPTLEGYFQILTERDRFIADMDKALEDWDVWLTPVAATVAFTHRPTWSAIDINGRSYPHGVANGAYTMPFNYSGHPAVIIPIGQTQKGLPIGLQIVGKRWREMELLTIAGQIDDILDDFQRPPGY